MENTKINKKRYTICDRETEITCRKSLFEFTKCLEKHSALHTERLKTIQTITEKLMYFNGRYAALVDNGCPDVDILTELKTSVINEALIQDTELNKLLKLNDISLELLHGKYQQFHYATKSLNYNTESNRDFIFGCATQKPMEFYLEKGAVILYFFKLFYKHMNIYGQHRIQFKEIITIQKFMNCLQMDPVFLEILNDYLLNSKCIKY